MASTYHDSGTSDQPAQPSLAIIPGRDTHSAHPGMQSKLLKTALAVIAGYNAWDMDAVMAPRADNCTQRVYPDRLDRPTLNNIAYREYFSKFLPYFENFTVTVTGIYVDEAANQVALQSFSKANSVIGPYGNEYVVMMKMTESQDKVYEIREFVDSEASAQFFPNLAAYIAAGKPGIAELNKGSSA